MRKAENDGKVCDGYVNEQSIDKKRNDVYSIIINNYFCNNFVFYYLSCYFYASIIPKDWSHNQ